MKALVIYDSVFGNTEKIAQAIGKRLASKLDIEILRASDVKPAQLTGFNLLIFGSPTRKFSPTPAITNLLKEIPRNGLKEVRAAAFDTRISVDDVKSRFLNFMVKLFGYAAEPIANRLQKKGAELIISPEGFIVNDSEGPLKEGELERAEDWASKIIAATS
ncbi:flavodoxin family protein [candidate division KSB1 bacterium]|nr:flavodoxin family protein [candidate division KSB1 bacterium]